MFLNKSDPNHYSDDSDVPIFMCRKKKQNKTKKNNKKTRANPCPFKAFQQLQKV